VKVIEAIHHLEEYPEMGAAATDLLPVGRYRHYICGRHRIIYRIDSEVLWILRIWDSRRNPADLRPE
jgi:hypothetical protein